jgi:hypothetical protein
MSLVPGGREDKSGNLFERLWVVSLALDVMGGRLATIKWEPLGAEGVECVVTDRDGIKIFYQCKIQNGNKEKWSISDLGAKRILQAAKTLLEDDPCCRFIFVSTDTARALHDMATHARSCDGDPAAFFDHCLNHLPTIAAMNASRP